jgi:vanillate O-demethylase ferredoxin subunit
VIKLLITGRRPVGMTVAEQHDYMRFHHGADVVALISTRPEVAPRRYVQNHAFDSSRRDGDGTDHLSLGRDFITQVWFDDPDQLAAAMTAPEYIDRLHVDEDNFVDQSTVVVLPVRESVHLARPPGGARVKLFVLHRRPDGVRATEQSTSDLWAGLLATSEHGVVGLVRNHVLTDAATAVAHIVDEVWLSSDEHARTVARIWLDTDPTTVVVLTREHVLFDGPTSTRPSTTAV